MNNRIALIIILVSVVVSVAVAQETEGQSVNRIHSFYFGNSFTGNAMPGLHPLLGESAGKVWEVDALISAGIPSWVHMKKQMDRGREYNIFHQKGPDVDAIVILIFGGEGLSSEVTEKWQGKVKFDEPTDIGDVASCAYLIREYLKLNPEGRVCIYTAWPGIPGIREFARRVKQEQLESALAEGGSRREIMKTIKYRELTHEELEPLRKSYDYAKQWLSEDYMPGVDDAELGRWQKYLGYLERNQRKNAAPFELSALLEFSEVDIEQFKTDLNLIGYEKQEIVPDLVEQTLEKAISAARNTHTRKHMYMLFEELKKRFPDLWEEKRLEMIPVGDVFLALDNKMREGLIPGIENIGQYSADGGHLRSGLPRYTLAATYFAVLFKDHPKHVDWGIFQKRENYDSKKFGFYVHQPDLAVHLDINDERAELVNDTIWEVLKEHPYCHVGGEE